MTPWTVAMLLAALPAVAPPLPPLPKAASSLGAIVLDGHLYVYGGHAGKTHTYDTTTALATFHRLVLKPGATWEMLPGGPAAQGLNLAASGGRVVRVGGMQPRNAPGEPADMHSLTGAAAFDPSAKVWKDLPPLPAGRSSHDVVAVGSKLVVVGGWDQKGKAATPVWHETAPILDLSATNPKWESVPQPFARRALTAAAVGTKVYVIAGMDAAGTTTLRVDVLDTATVTWTRGPDLPGKGHAGFSPAATVVNGRVVVSTSDGTVHRLNAAGKAWVKVGESKSHRMVARLVPYDSGVLLVGGASHDADGTVGELESVKLPAE
jgi:N-acetylneuraminic acid mutarotase